MKRHIFSHTALRGLAAFLVIFYHLQYGIMPHLAVEDATPFFRKGYIWVDLFFILSGFILSYIYYADRKDPYDLKQIGVFFSSRLARIYPLHIFTLMVMLVFQLALWLGFMAASHPKPFGRDLTDFAAQVALIQTWRPGDALGWNIPAWSISAEMHAYLLFPLMMWGLIRWPRLTQLMLLLVATAFYSWVSWGTGNLDITTRLALLRCLAGFSLGVLIYTHRHWFAAMPDRVLTFVQLFSVAAILVFMLRSSIDTVAVPLFALLIGTTWQDRGLVSRCLAHRRAVQLGELSYSIYLTHVPIIGMLLFFWVRTIGKLHLPIMVERSAFIFTVVVLVLAASNFTYRFVEQPARRALFEWLTHRSWPNRLKWPRGRFLRGG